MGWRIIRCSPFAIRIMNLSSFRASYNPVAGFAQSRSSLFWLVWAPGMSVLFRYSLSCVTDSLGATTLPGSEFG